MIDFQPWEVVVARLTIRAMQYFLAATDRGSIAHAAKELNVASSAISTVIDQVEDEFSLKLMQRFPARGIELTAAGINLSRKIRHLLEEYESLFIEGTELRTALSGTLSVGYYAPVAPAFIPPIVAPIMRRNPDLKLAFTECNNESAQVGLLNGTFDAIVFVSDNVRPGIICEHLIEAPPYLLAPKNHELTKCKSIRLKDLADVPLVLLDLPFTSQYLSGLLDMEKIDPPIVTTTSSTEMVRCLVGAGIGCSILNMRPSIERTYAGEAVVAIPIRGRPRPLQLVLGHLGGRQRRSVEVFMQACAAYFRSARAQKFTASMR